MAQKISAFPVIIGRGRRGGPTTKTWEPIPYKEIKELCKAAKEHGRGSHFFRNLLEATFSAYTLVPHDIKNIINCILSPAEYMLWERHWKRHLKTLSDTYAKDANQTDWTIEQLAGEGDLQKPSDQATTLPEVALQDIAIAAKTSLFLTPDDSVPTQYFSNIKQSAMKASFSLLIV